MSLPNSNENLLTIEEIVKKAKNSGVYFGFGDPYNRLRYYTKIGLLPHMIRKKDMNGTVGGHYPAWVVDKLVEIYRLSKEEKLSADEIKLKLGEGKFMSLEEKVIEVEKSMEEVLEENPTVELPKFLISSTEPAYANVTSPEPRSNFRLLAVTTLFCSMFLLILSVANYLKPSTVTFQPETLGDKTVVEEIVRDDGNGYISGTNEALVFGVPPVETGYIPSLRPVTPGSADIGSNLNYWNRIFAGGINLDGHGSLELSGDLRLTTIFPRDDLVIKSEKTQAFLDIQMAMRNTGPYNSGQVYVDDSFGVSGIMEVGGSAHFFSDVTIAGNQTILGGVTSSGASTFSGTTIFNNTATFNNNVNIGNSTSDLLTVLSYIVGDLIPNVNNTYDLGSLLNQWANIYAVNTIISNDLNVGGDSNFTGNLDVGGSGSFTGNLDVGGTGSFDNATVTNNLTVGGTLTVGSISPTGNIMMPDNTWIGLGAGAGRLLFSNQATDFLSLLDANVGIGTSAPGYKLEVNGSGLFTTLGVGATSPNYTLYTSGTFGVGSTAYFASNVGIGTTLPDSKLHIVGGDLYVASDSPAFGNASANEDLYVQGNLEVDGQCVTGDTLLSTVAENDLIFKQIKDIRGGEYVLSLNEETGKIVSAKIKGLLDMGVKPVFKLTTEDGRTIRTTGNHPYLKKLEVGNETGWTKVIYLKEGDEIAVADLSFGDSDPSFTDDNQLSGQASSLQTKESQRKVDNFLFGHLANQDNDYPGTLGNVETEDVAESSIESQKDSLARSGGFEDLFIVSAGQADFGNSQDVQARLLQGADQVQGDAFIGEDFVHYSGGNSQDFFFTQNTSGITESLASGFEGDDRILSGDFVNSITSLNQTQNVGDSDPRSGHCRLTEADFGLDSDSFGGVKDFVHSSEDYTSVASSCQEMATSGWQRVKSIESVGYEQVYDIEVEGTHNFVANGIIAHNTYIGAITATGDILPGTADTYNLGSATAEWNALYLGDDAGVYFGQDQNAHLFYDETTDDRLELTGTAFDLDLSGAFSLDSDSTLTLGGTRLIYTSDLAAGNGALEAISLKSSVDLGATDQLFEIGDGGGDFLTILGNGNVGIGTTLPDSKLHLVGGDLYVASDTPAFGNASANEDLYVQGNLEVDGTLYTAGQTIAGNLLPGTADTYDLGSATAEWNSLYLGDDAGVSFGESQDWSMLYDETTDDRLELTTAGTSGMMISTATASGTGLVLGADSVAAGTGMEISADVLSTGKGLYLSSTSTALSTGSLFNINWSPTADTYATGDLVNIGIGASGNVGNIFNITDTGSSLFAVSETAVTSNLPANFTASGDVSIANDLIFTNDTSANILSNAPMTIEAGDNFESSDLTLRTWNSGSLVLDLAGGMVLGQAQVWDLADTSTTSLNIDGGLMNFDTTNARVGIGTTAPGYKLEVNGSGLFTTLGVGATSPNYTLYTSGTFGVGSTAYFASNVGIGTTLPTAPLSVLKDAGTVATFDRLTDDGTLISLMQAGAEEGTISVAGADVSYNAFTGSHYAQSTEDLEKGMLVELTGENGRLHDNPTSEILYGVKKTDSKNDSAVLGVYLSLLEPSKEASVDNPVLVASVGNADLWVADNGENVVAGDYLISSLVVGHAEKEDPNALVSHIVARAAENIDWSTVTEEVSGVKHKKISVLLTNFSRNNLAGTVEAGILPVDNSSSDSAVETGPASPRLGGYIPSLHDDLASSTVAESLTVQQNLTVLGATSLNTLSVAGQTILGANMIFSDDGQSINTLVGNLKLQPLAKAGIDLFDGKVVFNKNGNLEIKAGVIAGNDSMRGEVSLEVDARQVVVTKAWETAPVSVTLTPSFNTKVWITDLTKDGFTINVSSAPTTTTESVYWLAIW